MGNKSIRADNGARPRPSFEPVGASLGESASGLRKPYAGSRRTRHEIDHEGSLPMVNLRAPGATLLPHLDSMCEPRSCCHVLVDAFYHNPVNNPGLLHVGDVAPAACGGELPEDWNCPNGVADLFTPGRDATK